MIQKEFKALSIGFLVLIHSWWGTKRNQKKEKLCCCQYHLIIFGHGIIFCLWYQCFTQNPPKSIIVGERKYFHFIQVHHDKKEKIFPSHFFASRKHIEVHGRPTAAVFRSKPNTHQDQVKNTNIHSKQIQIHTRTR